MDTTQTHNVTKLRKVHATMLSYQQSTQRYLKDKKFEGQYKEALEGELYAWENIITLATKHVKAIKGNFRITKVLRLLQDIQISKESTERMTKEITPEFFRYGVLRVYAAAEFLLKKEFGIEPGDHMNDAK